MSDAVIMWVHIVSATIWIGGMFYTLFVLKPNLDKLGEKKPEFLISVISKFFPFVWISIILLFITGGIYAKYFINNILFDIKLFIYFVMVVVFSYIYFGLYKKLPAIENKGLIFVKISNLITLNFILGLIIIFLIKAVKYTTF